jgi:hypothetical protein
MPFGNCGLCTTEQRPGELIPSAIRLVTALATLIRPVPWLPVSGSLPAGASGSTARSIGPLRVRLAWITDSWATPVRIAGRNVLLLDGALQVSALRGD